MFLGSTEAALMETFTPISRWPAKCAMKLACVHIGELRAPLCIQGDFMAHFAGQREIGVKFSKRAASLDPNNTQHTLLTIIFTLKRQPQTREVPQSTSFHKINQ